MFTSQQRSLTMSSVADKRLLCRLCGLSKDVVLLYIFAEENAHLQKEIEFLIKIKPTVNDALPPYICHRCNYRITGFKDFRNMCIKTLHHLQDKNVDSNEDDEVVIIDERTGDIPIPCLAQHGRNTEKENMSNGQYSELQDAQHFPQPQSSSASQQFLLVVSEDTNTYIKDQPFHNRICRKRNLPPSTGDLPAAPFHKKRQPPYQCRDQKELMYQQRQTSSLVSRRECIKKIRKLQHGFVSESSLPETLPEVVNEQVGTVGYLVPGTFNSESRQIMQRIESLHSNQQHEKRTDELRLQQLEAEKRNGFCASFANSESITLKEREPIYCAVCSKLFKNNVTLKEHVKYNHHFFQSEAKKNKPSSSCQSVLQPHMSQQLLD